MERWQALEGGPLMIVIGEVLLAVCSLSYLVWWTITFRPSVRTPGGGLVLAGAVLGGLSGLVLLAVGIVALLPIPSQSHVADDKIIDFPSSAAALRLLLSLLQLGRASPSV